MTQPIPAAGGGSMVEDAERYGLHTSEIEAIIARVATLTPEELEQLGLEWSSAFAVETDEELTERNVTRNAMFRARKTLEYRDVWDAMPYDDDASAPHEDVRAWY